MIGTDTCACGLFYGISLCHALASRQFDTTRTQTAKAAYNRRSVPSRAGPRCLPSTSLVRRNLPGPRSPLPPAAFPVYIRPPK